jgi:hypothetical protein
MDEPIADLCECGHEKRKHFFVGCNALGSCLHWSSSAEEYCGCDELHACSGGCAWDQSFLNKKRYVCSRCSPKLAAAECKSRKSQTSAAEAYAAQ